MNSKNNFKWLNQDLLSPNKKQRYYYDFGTGEKIEREEVKKQRDAFLGSISSNGAKPQKQEKDAFLEGFNDPYEEKLEQKRRQRERERKELFADLRANADKREWPSQNTSVPQTDQFLEGFNQEEKEKNKWILDFGRNKTTGILNPRVQTPNTSPVTTNAINRNPDAKNGVVPVGTHNPNEEPVLTQFSNDEKTSSSTKESDNKLKRLLFDAFAPVYLKPSAHTALWLAGAETYLKNKGYDTSAWLLKHSLQPNPEDVYRDDNSRIAQLIKNDPAFLNELDIAIANSDGKTLNKTISVPFKQGDLYYSIHKNDIKLTGYKDDNGKWKISARLTDEYNFSELTSWMDGEDATLGTLANDVAYFSEKIGAITPYNIYVDFNIER